MIYLKKTSLFLAAACLLAFAPAASAAALRQGLSGPQIASLNQRLAALSYLPAGYSSSSYSSQTTLAVIAFQKQAGLARDGVAGPLTLKALRHASRPSARYRVAKGAEISLSKQLLYLVRAGQVLRTIPISSGRPGLETVQGSFHVLYQQRMSWSQKYQSWMPYANYFYGGYAIHGYPDYEVPTYPASHGCVRVPMDFAYEVYHFLQPGYPVHVYS